MASLTTIPFDALKGVGGLCKVFLANTSDVSINLNSTTGICTIDASNAALFTKFVMRNETSGFVDTGTDNVQTGSSFYNPVLTLVFARNEALKRNQVKALAQSEVFGVAVDRNGTGWFLGDQLGTCKFGLNMTSSTISSGVAPGDLNGTTMVLSGNFANPVWAMDPSSLGYLG